jgi:hypothetical protein
MALVLLARYYNSFESGLARSVLAENGVQSFVFDNEMSWEGFGGVIIPVRLMVDEDDLDEARRILAAGTEMEGEAEVEDEDEDEG